MAVRTRKANTMKMTMTNVRMENPKMRSTRMKNTMTKIMRMEGTDEPCLGCNGYWDFSDQEVHF